MRVDVKAFTDGKKIWMNDAIRGRCRLRICGLEKLNGMTEVDAVMSIGEDGFVDVTVL